MSARAHASTLLAALVLGAAALAGCGSKATVQVQGSTLSVLLDEYRIRPQAVGIQAGRIRIVAHNVGALTHNVTVELTNRDSNGNPVVLGETPILLPGATRTLTITLHPGHYLLASSVSAQTDLGMTATLAVH
jgi:uncharacterized cupredoxin-like copper-binding protein